MNAIRSSVPHRVRPNPYRDFSRRQLVRIGFFPSMQVTLELPTNAEVTEQRTDGHSTDGLVAAFAPAGGAMAADPNTNRSARLHSCRVAVALRPLHQGLVEFARRRSDLSVHFHRVVVQERGFADAAIRWRQQARPGARAAVSKLQQRFGRAKGPGALLD